MFVVKLERKSASAKTWRQHALDVHLECILWCRPNENLQKEEEEKEKEEGGFLSFHFGRFLGLILYTYDFCSQIVLPGSRNTKSDMLDATVMDKELFHLAAPITSLQMAREDKKAQTDRRRGRIRIAFPRPLFSILSGCCPTALKIIGVILQRNNYIDKWTQRQKCAHHFKSTVCKIDNVYGSKIHF